MSDEREAMKHVSMTMVAAGHVCTDCGKEGRKKKKKERKSGGCAYHPK